jgi:hypothetical protein
MDASNLLIGIDVPKWRCEQPLTKRISALVAPTGRQREEKGPLVIQRPFESPVIP